MNESECFRAQLVILVPETLPKDQLVVLDNEEAEVVPTEDDICLPR